jgi:hemolysin activation/secretion protein
LLAALLASPAARAQAQPASASQPQPQDSFDIWEIRVLGNTSLTQIDVERSVYPSVGPKRTFQDIEKARDALVAAYRSHGFGAVFVDIPEQDVMDGVVRLQVTEGRLDRSRITGARYFANGRIRGELPALAKGQVLNTNDLQQQIQHVNRESADRTVVPVLRAGSTPGTVDVDLKVNDKVPVHATVDTNDRYTANSRHVRVGVNLSYDNLFQAFHSLSLQYQTTPSEPSQYRVIAGTYLIPVGDLSRLAVYVVDTNSDVAAVGALSVIGAGRIYGLKYIQPLSPVGSWYTQSVSFGVDYKDFRNTIHLTAGTDLTPIKYGLWGATYSANIQTSATLTTFNLTPVLGIRGVVNKEDQFDYKRYNARANFFYLRASAQHERPLLLGTRVFARLSAQAAGEPLIDNEQMSLGGFDTVRGYVEADALGDEGVSGSLEWRSPAFGPSLGESWGKSYLFSFFDAGFVRTLDPLPKQIARTNLSSWGVGFRATGLHGMQASFDWAKARQGTANTPAGASRVNFEFSYGF